MFNQRLAAILQPALLTALLTDHVTHTQTLLLNHTHTQINHTQKIHIFYMVFHTQSLRYFNIYQKETVTNLFNIEMDWLE